MEKKKVLIGMSGGVDSSVSALLLIKEGYEVVGATMKLHKYSKSFEKDIEDAKKVCKRLGIKHYVYDFTSEFEKYVIDDFVKSYMNAKTPNPCIECNRKLKFGMLYEVAKKLGCEYIATGHYANVEFSEKYNRYVITKSSASNKDQTYVLYSVDKDIIEHVLFPLSSFESKDEIRRVAKENNLEVESKKESQDICFIPDNDYVSYIENRENIKFKEGDIVNKENIVLGKHKGIIRYTIGQRRGLGISSEAPLYVVKLDKKGNKVIVSSKEDIFTNEIIATDINLQAIDTVIDGMQVTAKIRYSAKEARAKLYNLNENLKIVFEEPQRAVTPGQSVVFYDENIVIGGGKII